MENTTGKTGTDEASKDMRTLVQDGEDLLKQGDTESHPELRARLASALEAARAAGYRIEEKAVAGARATDRVIRDHPYHSIGIAFGIGVLVGVLVNRR